MERIAVKGLKLFCLIGLLFLEVTTRAQTCEEQADRHARTIYFDAYQRALNDCRNGVPLQCRSDIDCYQSQQCVSGRCVSRPQTCIPRCAARYSNGSCSSYVADYCGIDPVCVQKCSARYSNGSCSSYEADICGQRPISCVAQCKARYSNGSCSDYGGDICGYSPSCQPQCTARSSNGQCIQYGPDLCINQL